MTKVLKNIDFELKHSVSVPFSKSISNRVLILQYLLKRKLKQETPLKNLAESDDTKILENVLSSKFHCSIVDVKNAGTCFRFLTSLFSIVPGEVILTGSEEMKKRPIGELVKSLKDIGAQIQYIEKEGFPPLRIEGGEFEKNKVKVAANISSQFVTSLLLIAPFLENGLEIEQIGNVKSKSYIDMTISLLKEIGVEVEKIENIIKVKSLKTSKIKTFEIEADWSSASYWYELISFMEVGSKIQIKDLKKSSIQGDRVIASVFEQFGITTYFGKNGVEIIKTREVENFTFQHDFSSIPDMVQTMVVTCVGLGINGVFTGISHLVYKETNRIEALKNEILKLNYSLKMLDNETFKIEKTGNLPESILVSTYKDHRMALSFAPLVVKLSRIEIKNPNVIVKSYPDFWKEFC